MGGSKKLEYVYHLPWEVIIRAYVSRYPLHPKIPMMLGAEVSDCKWDPETGVLVVDRRMKAGQFIYTFFLLPFFFLFSLVVLFPFFLTRRLLFLTVPKIWKLLTGLSVCLAFTGCTCGKHPLST